MGPLDDPPTANKGGVRAPFFGLIPRGAGVHSRAPKARSTLGGCTAVRLRRRRELDLFRVTAGARRFAVARFRRELVLRVGSFGEYVGAALVFEAVGIVGTASEATSYKFGVLLWRAGQT